MNVEAIDNGILLIVKNLEKGNLEKKIIEAFLEVGFTNNDMFLLMTAAKTLYADRKNAIAPRKIFRRVE